jgi:hypothetical protein|tara:strand:+ start:183 stop:296 length:114 start_codon:yes stop_codon:yes gene_type:complete
MVIGLIQAIYRFLRTRGVEVDFDTVRLLAKVDKNLEF